jgi:hypothetical protein
MIMNSNNLYAMLHILMALYPEYKRVHKNKRVPLPVPDESRILDYLSFHSWVEDKTYNQMSTLLALLPETYQPALAQLDLFDDHRQLLLTYTRRHNFVVSSDASGDFFTHGGEGFAGKTFDEWMDDNQSLQKRQDALLQAYCGITSKGGNS